MPMQVDVSYCPSPHSLLNKIGRVLWGIVWLILYRPSPKIFHGWRRFLLKMFGAKIGQIQNFNMKFKYLTNADQTQ